MTYLYLSQGHTNQLQVDKQFDYHVNPDEDSQTLHAWYVAEGPYLVNSLTRYSVCHRGHY